LGGLRAVNAIQSKWGRLLKNFKYILTFEGYTGNGGGDGDSDGDADSAGAEVKMTARCLKAACDQGQAVSNLTAEIILHWQKVGWYDLFNDW